VTTIGRPATFEINTAAPRSPSDDNGGQPIAVELSPTSIGRNEEVQNVLFEIALTKGGAVRRGVRLELDETIVLATRAPRPPHDKLGPGWTYLVITPEIVE
jgi:hypothetical protein